jgi:hypothetical protein
VISGIVVSNVSHDLDLVLQRLRAQEAQQAELERELATLVQEQSAVRSLL